MKTIQYLENEFLTIDIQDSIEEIQEELSDYPFTYISVVDKLTWLGNISKNAFFQVKSTDWFKEIQNHLNSFKMEEEEDIFASLPLFENTDMDLIPILNEEGKWRGYLSINQLAKVLIHTELGSSKGGIIKINFNSQSNQISTIVRVIEENKGQIIRLFQRKKNPSEIHNATQLIIQIETTQFAKIIQNLERHQFQIENAFLFNNENQSTEVDHYFNLIKFLNI